MQKICRSDYFSFNDTATTEIYTLSLHDALPISWNEPSSESNSTSRPARVSPIPSRSLRTSLVWSRPRSEEHTSELQSRLHLVCRLLLEKKKNYTIKDCDICLTMIPCNSVPDYTL